jgi:hypothetical protein
MSLQTRLEALITAIGADVKALQAGGGGGSGVKTSALPAGGTLDGTELVPMVQGGVTEKTTSREIANLAAWENCAFSHSGALTVKVGASRYPIKGGTWEVVSVAAMVNTAPTGASVIVDVNKNGSTIFTTQANRPTVAASSTSATVGAFAATTLTDGDYLTVDVDQIGSTVAGSDLTVVVRMRRTA